VRALRVVPDGVLPNDLLPRCVQHQSRKDRGDRSHTHPVAPGRLRLLPARYLDALPEEGRHPLGHRQRGGSVNADVYLVPVQQSRLALGIHPREDQILPQQLGRLCGRNPHFGHHDVDPSRRRHHHEHSKGQFVVQHPPHQQNQLDDDLAAVVPRQLPLVRLLGRHSRQHHEYVHCKLDQPDGPGVLFRPNDSELYVLRLPLPRESLRLALRRGRVPLRSDLAAILDYHHRRQHPRAWNRPAHGGSRNGV